MSFQHLGPTRHLVGPSTWRPSCHASPAHRARYTHTAGCRLSRRRTCQSQRVSVLSQQQVRDIKRHVKHLQQTPLQAQCHRRLRVDDDPARLRDVHIEDSLPVESSGNRARAEGCNKPEIVRCWTLHSVVVVRAALTISLRRHAREMSGLFAGSKLVICKALMLCFEREMAGLNVLS